MHSLFRKKSMDAVNEQLLQPTEYPAADTDYKNPWYFKGTEPQLDKTGSDGRHERVRRAVEPLHALAKLAKNSDIAPQMPDKKEAQAPDADLDEVEIDAYQSGDTVVQIEMFEVPTALRGKGVGTRAYKRWEGELPKEIKLVRLWAADTDGEGSSAPFWESLGFSFVHAEQIGDPESDNLMWKGVNGHPTPKPKRGSEVGFEYLGDTPGQEAVIMMDPLRVPAEKRAKIDMGSEAEVLPPRLDQRSLLDEGVKKEIEVSKAAKMPKGHPLLRRK